MDGSPSSSQRKHPISCINCRTRKVKCDKVYPCAPCQKLQVDCTFRAKKARPKKSMASKAKSSDINSRLDRLDQLVSKLGSLQDVQLPQDVQNLLTGNTSAEQSKAGEVGPGTNKTSKESYFGPGGMYPVLRSEFWMNLSDEVDGLRHTLCYDSDEGTSESADDGDEVGSASTRTPINASSSPGTFLLSTSAAGMQGRKHPSSAEVLRLSETYFERVDAIFKFLHAPTVRDLVSRVIAQGPRPEISKPEQALLFSMYFAAVNSLSDQEYALLQQDRRSALMYYKNCTESALADADILCATDLITLQAFVIYLLALRSIDTSQATWSLIGLGIRLAQGLDLHREIACTHIPPYMLQMRRRLYWTLGLMDVQSWQDRGLTPLLQSNEPVFPQKPANVNDVDFGPDTKTPIFSKITMTEMTIPLVAAITTEAALKLVSRPPVTLQSGNTYLEDVLKQLHDNMCEQMQYFDMSLPICWFTKLVMRIAILKIWLYSHIPVHVRQRKSQPEVTKTDVMTCCIASMELHHDIQDSGPLKRFAWYHANWQGWHPLAVCLAELVTSPTGELADRAWMTVNDSYHQWKNNVADGRRGALWRPIKRLYEKAKRSRIQAMGGSYNTPSSDGASPNNDLGIPAHNLKDMGEERHRLHDRALMRSVNMDLNAASPMRFLQPGDTQGSLVETNFPTMSIASAPLVDPGDIPGLNSGNDTINWADWDTFLKESWETGEMGLQQPYDESLMDGIMNMPLEGMQPMQNQFSYAPPTQLQGLTLNQQLQAAAMRDSRRAQKQTQMKPWMDPNF